MQTETVNEAPSTGRTVSQAAEDYIKVIYKLQHAGGRVSTTDVARAMKTSAASVTKMSKHLAEHKLVTHEPYYGVRLTPVGEKIALETIRHHRLIELYLVQALGYGWDEVDAEAERLEHHISEEFEERIDKLLGHPQTDPHGDPIPTRDGMVASPAGIRLSEAPVGEPCVVLRVSDRSPDALRLLTQAGIHLGAIVTRLEPDTVNPASDSASAAANNAASNFGSGSAGDASAAFQINDCTVWMKRDLTARVFVVLERGG